MLSRGFRHRRERGGSDPLTEGLMSKRMVLTRRLRGHRCKLGRVARSLRYAAEERKKSRKPEPVDLHPTYRELRRTVGVIR